MNEDAIDLLTNFITTATRLRDWIIDHPSGNMIAPLPVSREYLHIITQISALATLTESTIVHLWNDAGQPYGDINIYKRYLGLAPEQVADYEQILAAYEKESPDATE